MFRELFSWAFGDSEKPVDPVESVSTLCTRCGEHYDNKYFHVCERTS